MDHSEGLINYKKIVCSWSGGIDSTALIGKLAQKGYSILAVYLDLYDIGFSDREKRARDKLFPIIKNTAQKRGGDLAVEICDGNWLWNFSNDGVEIPRRNKLIIDYMIENYMIPEGIINIGMGEYIGADSWHIQDHVSMADADQRTLASYILHEYGLNYRLITLADFGESRYKVNRLNLGFEAIGENMNATTNCLRSVKDHCGTCYKCVERNVAFHLLDKKDETYYMSEPKDSEMYDDYLDQMKDFFL